MSVEVQMKLCMQVNSENRSSLLHLLRPSAFALWDGIGLDRFGLISYITISNWLGLVDITAKI